MPPRSRRRRSSSTDGTTPQSALRALAPVVFELGDMVASSESTALHILQQPRKCVTDAMEMNRGGLVYNTLRQFCKLARAADLVDVHARARGMPYATVFMTRPDPRFLVLPMTVDLDNNSISVGNAPFVTWSDFPGKRWWSSEALDGAVVTHTVVILQAWWNGVNDQIAFGRAAEMLRFLRDPLAALGGDVQPRRTTQPRNGHVERLSTGHRDAETGKL